MYSIKCSLPLQRINIPSCKGFKVFFSNALSLVVPHAVPHHVIKKPFARLRNKSTEKKFIDHIGKPFRKYLD